MNKLKAAYISSEEFQINIEIPDKIINEYSKEDIAIGLMCVVDNWVKEELELLEEEKNECNNRNI